MTNDEKNVIYTQFHNIADIQAKSIIEAIENLDKHFKDITPEQHDAAVRMLISLSLNTLKISTDELAKNMNENISKIKLEDLNVG